MTTTRRSYTGDDDFMRIRQFLIDTYGLYQRPFNWLIDRWNFCRYHVIPLHTYYNTQYFGVPTGAPTPHRDELPYWEQSIRIWENDAGEIVGVTHSENEEAGEAWIQIHPDYTHLYDKMVTTVEETLASWVEGLGYVKLYVDDGDAALETVARQRGYRKLKKFGARRLQYIIDPADLPPPAFPEGFILKTVAEEDDKEKRRRAKALAFGGHYNPIDWPPAAAFAEMQRAPDYRPELDLFLVAPDGEYVSFTTIWLDEQNKYGIFEPVGTHIEYQGLGLGRALLREGFRRMAARGMERSYMHPGVDFYRKIGFEPLPYSYYPWIKYLE
jgi:predicted N-acetyltransferase YhbS